MNASRAVRLIAACVLAQACGDGGSGSPFDEEEGLIGNFLPPTNEGVAFDVPSHPSGSYRLLRWKPLANGNIEALTRQDSRYGTIITLKEIDCQNRLFRTLGQGETEEQALKPRPDERMSNLIEGSIQDVTLNVVCREAKP